MPRSTINVDARDWEVAEGFNLYIDISSACNASCPFCIAPTVGRKDGPDFFKGLDFALDLTKSIDGTVQVVGGEPMISKRLPRVLYEIGERRFRRSVLNTNGSFITDGKISMINSAGIGKVNISRHHYDDAKNQQVMRLRPELPNSEIASSVRRLIDSGNDVRMQCNLIDGYIDSVEEMVNYINWTSHLGARSVSFSQIFPLGLFDYQVPIEKGYTERVQIDLRKLVSDLDNSGMFSPIRADKVLGGVSSTWGGASSWGSASSTWGSPGAWGSNAKRRFWYGPDKTYISLKTLSGYDNNGLPRTTSYDKSEDPELQDGILAFGVLHSDGRVTASWDRRERILYDPNKESGIGNKKSLDSVLIPA